MRALVITCLVTLATADQLGYNYQPVSHSGSGLSFSPGASNTGISRVFPGDQGGINRGSGGINRGIGNGISGIGSPLSGGVGGIGRLNGGSSDSGSSDSSSGGTSSGIDSSSDSSSASSSDYSRRSGPGNSASNNAPGTVSYEKEFFTFTADENDFNQPQANDPVVNSVRKSLRVIFIKGPENNGLENAVLNVAKHASEQKTAIYVLQKQTDLAELASKLQSAPDIQNQQPEVHFVKYRTPEDAANAQSAIQSQYDQLGGTSTSHDGGSVPIHNFASPANRNVGHSDAIAGPGSGIAGDVGRVGGVSGGFGPGGSISGVLSISAAPRATYLPASIVRTLRL